MMQLARDRLLKEDHVTSWFISQTSISCSNTERFKERSTCYIGIGVWAGGAAAPPQLLGNSVFWAAAVLFWGSSNGGGGGCFSILRRADDVTRTMSKGGGGVLVNVQEWGCFSIFRRADDVGVLVNVFNPPPPFRKSCIRACYLCKISGKSTPLPP